MKNIFIIPIFFSGIIGCNTFSENASSTLVDSTTTHTTTLTNNNKALYVFYDDEAGTCGYTNEKGDTIIRPGTYQHCFTETAKYFAVVMGQNNKCQAIDKNGKFMYEVFFYDNGPDYISDGLFRIVVNGKIGYSNTKGEIIIQPQYECTNPFEKGKAQVALTCQLIPDGEYTRMESKEWITINKKGKRID